MGQTKIENARTSVYVGLRGEKRVTDREREGVRKQERYKGRDKNKY